MSLNPEPRHRSFSSSSSPGHRECRQALAGHGSAWSCWPGAVKRLCSSRTALAEVRPYAIRHTTAPAPASGGGSPPSCSSAAATANAPGSLVLFQVVAIQLSERWTREMRNSSICSPRPASRSCSCHLLRCAAGFSEGRGRVPNRRRRPPRPKRELKPTSQRGQGKVVNSWTPEVSVSSLPGPSCERMKSNRSASSRPATCATGAHRPTRRPASRTRPPGRGGNRASSACWRCGRRRR